MIEGTKNSITLLNRWVHFLQHGVIRPIYQPIVEMQTGRIIGYEVLSRAFDQKGNSFDLELLFQAAESAQQLGVLDDMMLRSCLSGIDSVTGAMYRFFVNVLPDTLSSGRLVELLTSIGQETLLQNSLVFEVNERTADPTTAKWEELLAPLRSLGVEIAIDDVGSGYAGLNRTVEIAPNWLKMDIGLVRNIDSNPLKSAMVASIVTFAKRLGSLHIIAEGVETQAEYETLLEMGIEFGQGYLFAKPQPTLLSCAHVTLPTTSARNPERVDYERFGPVLADFVVRLNQFDQGKKTIVSDVQWYINQIVPIDHIAVFRTLDPTAPVQGFVQESMAKEQGVLPQLNSEIRERLSRGLEYIVQEDSLTTCTYSLLHSCQSTVLVPLWTRGKLHGILYGGFSEPCQVRSEVISVLRGFAAVLSFYLEQQPTLPQDHVV